MRKMEIEINDTKININIFNKHDSAMYSCEESRIIMIPKTFQISERLKYIRKMVRTVVVEKNIKNITTTLADTTERNIIDVIKYEGIIEELLSGIEVI